MRYKEFNNQKVLEDCISLFWENSFKGTPINSIVKKTHVNRFSLNEEFENKQGILYEAINLYKVRYSDTFLEKLKTQGEVVEELKRFFNHYLQRKKNPPGCFLIYIATELGDNDAMVNSVLKDYLNQMETKFISLLKAHSIYKKKAEIIANNLILLFCNSMCSCHIQKEEESKELISLNLDLILNN